MSYTHRGGLMRFVDPLYKQDAGSYKNCKECQAKNTITCKFCLEKYCVYHRLPEQQIVIQP